MNKQQVIFRDLGLMNYQSAWDYQESLLQENVRRKSEARSREEVGVVIALRGTKQEANQQKSEVGGQKSEVGIVIALRGTKQEAKQQMSDKGVLQSDLILPTSDLQLPTSDLSTQHYLLFVEHPPVYTLGKSGNIENVLISEEMRSVKGIEFFRTNRGGDITFHGPQQIVGYPILDLEKFETDIGKYLRNIEEVIILTLAEYGIESGRSPGETGVWIDANNPGRERKICAIGVRTSRWITMHGFALNVNTDLEYFNFIIPCGIQGKQVTSIEKELGRNIDFEEAKEKVKRNFEKVFDVDLSY